MASPLVTVGEHTRPQHLILGKQGEDVAVRCLRSMGYEIRGTNIRLGRDEIDILAYDLLDEVLVFVEVKTRSHFDAEFLPEKTADWRKRIKLRRAARRWISDHEYDDGYRIDLVCVCDGRVTEHFKDLSAE